MEYIEEINNLIEDFSFFENWEDKYQYLIDLGRSAPKMDSYLKVDENKLKGCQSVVHFYFSDNSDGTINFIASSDAAIVQGLIALMIKVFSDRTPKDIININLNFLEKIGLDEHLSPTRKNGLSSLISSIKNAAKLKLD
ncbi:SufE family protein [Pseudomonadota bacterium]|jgi:cysteine desulfuration protein SufE|nr:SufE family protein [Pseudomonadota bacterium]|tara:strand:+ start:89 stop:505 length:417 start_codon:yes stop_codon:yes gene_type:complete